MSDDDLRIQLDLKIPMRDGVRLHTVVYRPAHGERFPVLLIRSPYGTQHPRYVEWAARFARSGYGVVMQDCRGRYESEGEWRPYIDETNDGYDTQQWVGAQPWCDGNIGTFGTSYVGFTQILPATLRSLYVKALVPIANQEDNYGHLRCNGVLQLQNAMNFLALGQRMLLPVHIELIDLKTVYRRLPLISALDDLADRPFYREMIRHERFDEFWRSYSMKGRYGEVDVPAYFITGWYDNLMHEMFKCFRGWKHEARTPDVRAQTKLLVGPWPHSTIGTPATGDVHFGHAAAVDIPGAHLRWYDRRLKRIDNGIDDEAPIRLFVMGENVWRDESEWPLARTQYTKFYLHSGGRANSFFGDGILSLDPPDNEPPDTFTYDPDHPVPTLGGQSMFMENTGPKDRRPVERRDDVLVYSTAPLPHDLEVTGPVELTLYAASSAPDTDFTATLVDVHPDGRAIHLCEGIVRARFRESCEASTLITPGIIYAYTISLWETSNLFKAGHCIRLEVSSSNFPRFDRNLNTGQPAGFDTNMQIAHQTVYHNPHCPSHLTLPVIPR
ncbi:MAG: CocE/NonD family hydrolase [Candidatus Latescibacteria bacterium]|nr:CocE/NonD family hydrolase [Candidatus Latescibacterota bacterium]